MVRHRLLVLMIFVLDFILTNSTIAISMQLLTSSTTLCLSPWKPISLYNFFLLMTRSSSLHSQKHASGNKSVDILQELVKVSRYQDAFAWLAKACWRHACCKLSTDLMQGIKRWNWMAKTETENRNWNGDKTLKYNGDKRPGNEY